MKKLTPAQQQYANMKRQYPDCLLLFRLGDFYEVFHEDAHIAHKVLGITLTARDKNASDPIPMAGIPHHALEKYLPLLIQAGYKVAIADQVGEVIPGKLVERKITQIHTPGTRVEQGSLATCLLSVTQHPNYRALARGDMTLGVWNTRICLTRDELLEAILHVAPREIICDGSVHDISFFEYRAKEHLACLVSLIPVVTDAEQWLLNALQVSSLAGYGDALLDDEAKQAFASLLRYLQDRKQPIMVRRVVARQQNKYVHLDQLTIKNLEVFEGSYQGNKKQSLFGVINKCTTSMGSRLLAELLTHPIQDLTIIHHTQQHISYRSERVSLAQEIHRLLSQLSDIPRIAQQITQKKHFIYLLRQLAEQIQQLHTHQSFFCYLQEQEVDLMHTLDIFISDVLSLIASGPRDEENWIADGQDTKVDRLRHIDTEADQKMLAYQQAWLSRSGVSVKIKHITNQGYVLEVTPKDIKKFESFLENTDPYRGAVRAQTLKTGQRYITSYLQEIQREIFASKENLSVYHKTQAEKIFVRWQKVAPLFLRYADLIAQIDLFTTMSLLMHEQDWSLPQMVAEGDLHIIAGRHPLVEAFLPKDEQFIPNDLLCTKESFFHLITGPNMGGKSTYMRQQALILLLAHAGLPVPAKSATIPLIDGLFARIGSGDLLAKQQSTFMTEMIETATILHHATNNSFVIFDELGRGTSTHDGLALAKAITVYICHQVKAKTLFATHYHELIALAGEVAGIQNWHVGVHETEHEIVFLKTISPGGTDKSYGLDVAKLAGIPLSVITLASSYLLQEPVSTTVSQKQQLVIQDSLFMDTKDDPRVLLLEELRTAYSTLDVYAITPFDALHILQEIIIKLSK